jgi:starch phosphorylase
MVALDPRIAYFSMEIALESGLPTYAGGLGVLAGDTLRSCADLGLAVCGVTLVHRQGYFQQGIAANGKQRELPDEWRPEDRLEALSPRVAVDVGGKSVRLRAWRYRIASERGSEVPVYLLDADLPENAAEHRRLTDRLYGGDDAYRLGQEIVLGVGGVRMLRALGHAEIDRFHLNEGHAALAIPELIDTLSVPPGGDREAAVERIRSHCIFTTHTPVPAGHDRFPKRLWEPQVGKCIAARLAELGVEDELNLTQVALDGARFVNGVAMRHGEVSRSMFPGYPIRSITNGVHLPTWASPSFRALFDRYIPHWRSDAFSLRHATAIALDEIAAAHAEAKRRLLETVRDRTGRALDPAVLTLGFGRRATAYKRATLVLRDLAALRRIRAGAGPLQLVFGGKAHPNDAEGRQIILEIHRLARKAGYDLPIVFLPGYDMDVCARLVAGCDVWLNTPVPPLEASGTSGMKAAVNGVPSLSMLDGWWVEGCIENVTGWAIGGDREGNELPAAERDRLHAAQLYEKLESVVAPCFYRDPEQFLRIMRQAIAINASHFNTQRMVQEYLFEAYQNGDGVPADPLWAI